ncbi:chemotaxis protein CheA [Telmatospirillum siberiense]|uniref:Chemotaxis protein CheA n=1 Tax=Telmatospirillum siberiense TaxID=382514 RepID=A0A2N3PLV7_9PROT|nr:chemotaxis protein CheA [Telmatospirillum siberiense]PKU21381.1 chemotaxis protein CheA [Telmatospirillum siberiense]
MNSPDPGEIFRTEAQELLEQLEQALLDLETAPEDGELISSAFRALHTLKGSGAMFGFDAAARFAHGLENAFDLVRKGKVAASGALIGVALSAKDHLRLLIERPEEASSDESARILANLAKTIGAAGTAETAAATDEGADGATQGETSSATYRIQIRFPEDVMDNGTNPLLLIGELQDLGTCTVSPLTERVPPLDDIKPSACYVGWDVVLTTEKPRSAIEEVFIFVLDDMDLRVEKVEETSKRLGEILVERGDTPPDAVLTALSNQQRLGEILVKDGAASKERVASALAEQRHLTAAAAQAPQKAQPLQDSIKVPAERLDNLMDRVGELVIAQARLREIATASQDLALKVVAEEIERLASELRDNTMGIRMVPIGSLFGRFRRLVRDLSRELGKKVQLFTSGEETELDKTMIERLNDPMIHLIRNCIDHGLERPDVRTQAGKLQEGRVELSAVHSGAQVIISIKDDGKGLDRTRIRARAEEMGYLAPGAKVTDNELFQVIFQPGFSTSREVTNVSGRGVGMDVVKRTIEGLRGAIEINSTEGHGTEITLKLPLTLAIIDGLLVRVGLGRYVIPLSMVEECVELTPEQNLRAKNRNFLSIRGELVPFLRLRDMFNVTADAEPFPKVVIVSAGDLRVGLLVDQVIGDHQTVIKTLTKLHADVETFSGATILGDGSVALILDIDHLIDFGRAQEERLKAS